MKTMFFYSKLALLGYFFCLAGTATAQSENKELPIAAPTYTYSWCQTNAKLKAQLGVLLNGNTEAGLLILKVFPNSAAAFAGLQVDYQILSINDFGGHYQKELNLNRDILRGFILL